MDNPKEGPIYVCTEEEFKKLGHKEVQKIFAKRSILIKDCDTSKSPFHSFGLKELGMVGALDQVTDIQGISNYISFFLKPN